MGKAIVDVVQSLGGALTMEDLAAHSTDYPDALSVNYHGVPTPPHGISKASSASLRYTPRQIPVAH